MRENYFQCFSRKCIEMCPRMHPTARMSNILFAIEDLNLNYWIRFQFKSISRFPSYRKRIFYLFSAFSPKYLYFPSLFDSTIEPNFRILRIHIKSRLTFGKFVCYLFSGENRALFGIPGSDAVQSVSHKSERYSALGSETLTSSDSTPLSLQCYANKQMICQ